MPLTANEATTNYARLRADIETLRDALRKDADGKVRITAEERADILLMLRHVLTLVIDILD